MNNDPKDTVAVFTCRSPERIVREGGSQGWILSPMRVKRFKWLICVQNQHNKDLDFSDATEAHGTAFLLGKISGVRRSEEGSDQRRYLVEINEYARIAVPSFWDGNHNPVRYLSMADLGVDPSGLEWHSMPAQVPTVSTEEEASPGDVVAQARTRIAAAYGVKPSAVQISVQF
jgi:hypothetical protein